MDAGAPKTVKLTINGIELEVPQGELIVESVKRLGLEIPVFCYHPRMKPVGMCRMCIVEVGFSQPDGSVRMMPKPQAGCTLPAGDGMVVVTDSENVHRDRRGVLEFLLANHPLDCPICDRGGECPLQNNTLAYGPSTSRFIELKRHLPKAFPLSQYVTLDLERCIQCGRCVRFTEEISGEHELAFRFRGANMQPSTFQLNDFESKFSGNVIEICPVGALTSAKYRFRARPWDLEASKSVCTECSNGCSVWFDHRAGKLVRINGRANDAVNEEWTCDKGKFGHDWYNSSKRLTVPLVRKGDALEQVSWAEAYEHIVKGLDRPGSDCAAVTGPRVSTEGLWAMRTLFGEVIKDASLTCEGPGSPSTVTASLSDFENDSGIVVVGTHLADELPIAYLRLRKAATQCGVRVGVMVSGPDETDGFAHYSHKGDTDTAVADLIDGSWEGTALLGPGCILLCTRSIGQKAHDLLKSHCERVGAKFNCWATGTNAHGAELLGLASGTVGSAKALWLTECDLEGSSTAALEAADFLVVQSTVWSESCNYASVVLPMSAPAEQDGTWVNCEGRVQKIQQVLSAPGEAKPAWRIFGELALRLAPQTPWFNAREVFESVCAAVPAFSGCDWTKIPDTGQLLGPKPDREPVGGPA